MERERQAKLQGSRPERHKPAEFMSQLALKRGAKRRGDKCGPDYKSGTAAAVLLSHNPDFRYFYKNDAQELADHLHWFDELAGCASLWLPYSTPYPTSTHVPHQHDAVQAIRNGVAARPRQAPALQLCGPAETEGICRHISAKPQTAAQAAGVCCLVPVALSPILTSCTLY